LWRNLMMRMRIFVTCTPMVRTMVRVMVRTRRLIQRDAVSRTTMWVHIPTHRVRTFTDGRWRWGARCHHRRRSSSSSDADDTGPEVRRRHRIKSRTFDGTGSFESFWAHFENCASYNRWNDADKLAHLKASLTGDAGQVLLNTDATSTDTIEKLMALLRNRYSGARQSDKYRMKVRLRRRRPGEPLSSLHHDIRRLMTLAYPTLQPEARESIACDHYIDALDDADFGMKVRERAPTSLDDALRVSLQLEAWMKDATRTAVNSLQSRRCEVRTRRRMTMNNSVLA